MQIYNTRRATLVDNRPLLLHKYIYLNDFSISVYLHFSTLFTDDTSVVIESAHFDDITHVLNLDLETVNSWFKANKLTAFFRQFTII